ncbi:hypothetical protein D9M73_136740 [compost metagenome]
MLVGRQHVLGERLEDDDQHRAHRPEEADRANGEEQAADVHRRRNQPPGGCEGIVADDQFTAFAQCRRNLQRGDPSDRRDHQHHDRGVLHGDEAAKHGADQDREIGARFDQSRAAQNFVFVQMLRQDRIFDRPEKRGVHAKKQHGRQHQHQPGGGIACPGDHQPARADDHDADLGGFHQPDDLGLVVRIGQLPGERGKQEERQDAKRGRECREILLQPLIGENPINGELHHHRLEQIVVERPEKLRDEQGQKPALFQQAERIEHGVFRGLDMAK